MPINSNSTPLISLSAIVLDTETTGLDVRTARVVQIGAVRITLGELQPTERFEELVDPGIAIPADSTAIHGLREGDLEGARTFEHVAAQFEAFTNHSVIIGHNIGYDLAILMHEYGRLGKSWKRPRSLDTMVLSQVANPSLPNYSIEAVANWLGVEIGERHTASGDALTTARIFLALVPILRSKGLRTLAEAERSSRRLGDILFQHESIGWLEPSIDPRVPAVDVAKRVSRFDSFLFRHKVRDVMSSPPVTADPDLRPAELVRLLVDHHVSAAFINPTADHEGGIITERDLMRALIAPEPENLSARDVMSSPVHSISADSYIYQAISVMRQHSIRHLGVTDDDGTLIGALSNTDLLKQRAGDAILLGDELASTQGTAALAATWSRIPVLVRKLVDEGLLPHDITSIVSEELCLVTKRAAEIAETRMEDEGLGSPPVPYALLVLGSGGRGETLLAPDQDNAIIFEKGAAGGREDRWFGRLGEHISDILNDIGIPYCNGGVMASRPDWRHSVADWQVIIDEWIAASEPTDLLNVDIFYDFRCVHGDRQLAQEIRRYAQAQARNSPAFIMSLSRLTEHAQPPINLLGRIRTKDGYLELKRNTLLNIIGGARTLALRYGVERRATHERLNDVRGKSGMSREQLENILEAHRILLGEALSQQLMDIENGIPPSYRIEVNRLSKRRKEQLRWALIQVDVMKDVVGP